MTKTEKLDEILKIIEYIENEEGGYCHFYISRKHSKARLLLMRY